MASITAPTACIGPAMQWEPDQCWWPMPGLHLRLWPQRAPGRRASQQAIAIHYFRKRKALFSKTFFLKKRTPMEIAHKSSMFLESREGGRGGSHLIHPASAAGPEPSERLRAEPPSVSADVFRGSQSRTVLHVLVWRSRRVCV